MFTDTSPLEYSREAEDQTFLLAISHLTGLPTSEIHIEELRALYSGMFRQSRSYTEVPFKNKYVVRTDDSSDALLQLIEALTDIRPISLSYGLFLPEYQRMLKECARTGSPVDKPHQALLAGAFTSATMEEFAFGVHSVFPSGVCRVIDVQSRIPNSSDIQFIRGNILTPPTELQGTIDSLHTNALTNNLMGVGKRWEIELKREQLLAHACEVLKPDGALMMIESVSDNSGRQNPDAVRDVLTQSGFKDISIEPAQRFANRRDMYRVLWGKQQLGNVTQEQSSMWAIFARKQA